MQIRTTIQLGDASKKIVLVSQDNETPEHLALKLAGFILFFHLNPLIDASLKNPALMGQEFKPDLIALDEFGEIGLWVECGNVTTHKMDKLIRRYRNARIIALKSNQREAENLRRALKKNEISNSDRVEIWYFPNRSFDEWLQAVENDSVEIFGEPADQAFNLVANAIPFNFDFSVG